MGELVPRPPRRAKRDEQVRRLTRRLVRSNPAWDDPAHRLAVRRLAQLSLLAERLYDRARAAETGDNPEGFILAVESFRRAAQTAALLEKNLNAATRVLDPPHDITVELARRIRDQRAASGAQINFSPPGRDDGQN